MRKSFTATVALAAVLAVSAPVTAAPSGKSETRQQSSVREREQSPAMKAVLRLLKKFGINTQAFPIGPWPDNDESNNTNGGTGN